MDPPSTQLVRRLAALGLQVPRDLNRCRAHVRRLSRDLPTFDSVWIDALVQGRRLTPYQSNCLESAAPDQLIAGPYVILNRLGGDGCFTHFEARQRSDGRHVIVSQLHQPLPNQAATLERLQTHLRQLQPLAHPGLQGLCGCGTDRSSIHVVGDSIPGEPLHGLLVRRGRFAPDAVLAITRQLVDALAALAGIGRLHGDLRLCNIRLTPSGQCVLMCPGLAAAVWPELTIHAGLPPDACDTIAPERIGTGRPADTASEMYALGCVLWELLAGRPPFALGDPLAKLAAHQSRAIPDVRTWAPDTPPDFAKLLSSLTHRDPALRPPGFAELMGVIRCGTRTARRRLRGDFRRFGGPAVGPARGTLTRGVRRAGLAMLVLLAAACGALSHSGARTYLLHIGPLSMSARADAAGEGKASIRTRSADVPGTAAGELLPFPSRIDGGVLRLEHPGPYDAGEIATAGLLRVQGSSSTHSVILVRDQPLRFRAEQLILENIEVRDDRTGAASGAADSGGQPLLVVDAQSFALRDCGFLMAGEASIPAIEWSPIDPESAEPQRTVIAATRFQGAGVAVRALGRPSTITFECVLKVGPGALLEIVSPPDGDLAPRIALTHTTLRDAGGIARIVSPSGGPSGLSGFQLPLTLEGCVLDISPGSAALIEFAGEAPPRDWDRRLRIGGENTIVRPGTPIAGLWPDTTGAWRELSAGGVAIDGLLADDFGFAGPPDADPAHSAVSRHRGHGRSLQPPGIDVRRFAGAGRAVYNSSPSDSPAEAAREPSPEP